MMDTTEDLAYDTAMDALEVGQIPACVPVSVNGTKGLWTLSGDLGGYVIKDDIDALAAAYLAIKRARDNAERAGCHPVD